MDPLENGDNVDANPYEQTGFVSETISDQKGNGSTDLFSEVEVPTEVKHSEDQEPTVFSVWMESHRQMLEEKAKKEREEQDKLQKQAKEDIQKFHDDRKRRINETKQQNKTKESQLREDLQAVFEHGTIWEQVAKMVNLQEQTDTSGLSGDQERMRTLLIQLKNDKKSAKNS